MNIEYCFSTNAIIRVVLSGKTVGKIKHVDASPEHKSGWQYFPNGQVQGGEVFPTLASCKRSLENE